MHSTRDQTSERADAIGRKSYSWALWICAGAALGGLGVAIGAAGTHVLEGRIDSDALDTLETAVRFQMYHALALIALGAVAAVWEARLVTVAGVLLSIGTVIFCGSLYILALLGIGVFGAVAPIGGLSLMAGWGALAIGAGFELFQSIKGGHR